MITTLTTALFQSLYHDNGKNAPVSTSIIVTVASAVALFVGLGAYINPILGIIPVGILIAALMVMFFIRYPRIWLYFGALLNYFWIAQAKGDTDISAKEYGLVLFYFGGLGIWFFSMIVVQKRRVIRHWGDKMILSALGLSVINLFISLMNGTPPLTWVREWLLFLNILYYFPWREHLTEERHINIFFVCHATVFIVIGGTNLYQYVKAANNVIYAFQIWTSRKMMNTHIFMCATLFAILSGLYALRGRTKLIMLGLAGFYGVVVVVSFSRGFWLSGIFAIIVILWVLDKRKLALFSLYGMLGAVIFTFAVQIVFPDKAAFIFRVLKMRLASSATGTQDISLLSRYIETQAILALVQQYPLSGFGLGSSFSAYDPIERVRYTAIFIHNGYLYIWVKLGLPFFIAYFSFWAYMTRRAYRVARTTSLPMAKILASGCAACMTAFWLLNTTSSISEGRDGFYCLSICFASLGFAETLIEKHSEQKHS